MGKIILTSQGLCTQMGDRLIHRAISDMGDRENKKILLVDIKKYRITEKLKDVCISMGFEKSNIFVTSEAEAGDFPDFFEYYYVTAGNTFEIFFLYKHTFHIFSFKYFSNPFTLFTCKHRIVFFTKNHL